MEVRGTITRVTYYNTTNGYSVLMIKLDEEDYKIKRTKSHLIGNQLVVVGSLDRKPIENEEYIFFGEFVKDINYGLQFKFDSFSRCELYTEESVINYLSSPIFPNIGIKTAKTIVNKLGVDAINIIANNKDALNGLGISAKNQDTIFTAILDNRINEQIIMFFLSHGIRIDLCHKIAAIFGPSAIEIIKEEPYLLMKRLDHFGFIKNDNFALSLGLEPKSPKRLSAIIKYILNTTIYNTGNSFVSKATLLKEANNYLKEHQMTKDEYTSILEQLTIKKEIFINASGEVFDFDLYQKENDLAYEIAAKLKYTPCFSDKFTDDKIDKAFQKITKSSNITLNDEQLTAVNSAFKEPMIIITGGPGTGKTTIIRNIINLYIELLSNKKTNTTAATSIALLAPTGRAAKRLSEVCGINASTIHKYLGYTGDGHFSYDKDNKTTESLIIVDESSMMDLPLAYQLFTSIPQNSRVIIVGDVDQLPSVGPGQILKDLIDSKEITTIRLKKIHRQSEGSKIIEFAHDANNGIVSDNILTKFKDRTFIPTDSEHLSKMIVELVERLVKKGKDILKDIQVLIPMYRCKSGINEINDLVQQAINPKKDDEDELVAGGITYRINDKVIQLVNRTEKNIMNGDIGYVKGFSYLDGEINSMSVAFDFGVVDYALNEIDDLKLAYAISIHKAQGSEFDTVIMPLSYSYYVLFKRKLIYTAITRSKNHLILLGDINVFKNGISQIEANRSTILLSRIKENLDTKETIIDDDSSAFSTLGEYELNDLSPYDFLDEKENN